MNKLITALLCISALCVKAQTQQTQPYGKIDIADLSMKSCDFETDANAEVLFNKGEVYYDMTLSNISMDVHKRIKIFNDNGKDAANIHIIYYGSGNNKLEFITGLQAQTINLVDGKPEITKLEKNLIYNKTIDKSRSEVSFTLPNVKSGSVIEFKYTWTTQAFYNFPDWAFQEKIPTRYSELSTEIPEMFYFRPYTHIDGAFAKLTTESDSKRLGGNNGITVLYEKTTRALANIKALPDEPYMTAEIDNMQRIVFQLVSVKPVDGMVKSYSDTWGKVGGILIEDEDFGDQLKRKLKDEESIISKATTLKTSDEKIAYLFKLVKDGMKWNDVDRWYTIDGTVKAWESKVGNSAEINLILYHLLKQSGVDAYPMVVSTKDHGKVDRYYTSLSQFNRAVVYIPVDSTKNYVLDATGKYNIYNETPANLLNSTGLYINKTAKEYNTVFLEKANPVKQAITINAEIKPGGKIEGTANISSTSYNRISAIERFKKDGEKKYIDYLRDNDNSLKISALKFENMEVDTLPLTQTATFNLETTGSDENYIYLNPNLFSSFKTNPFLSENRVTDIDFVNLKSYYINGTYKLPAGYKVDAIPKNVTLTMPDGSISFNRFIAQDNDNIVIRYTVKYNKIRFLKSEYPEFHDFYKKMYEMFNEQVVLKKG
jgi:hypothetical protein